MKQIYLLMAAVLLSLGMVQAQCVVDPNAQTFPGVNMGPDELPCIVTGVPYDQTLQGQIQTGDDISILILTLNVVVDSVRVDSIAGLPNGITWNRNPEVLPGGGNGCIQFTGTTSDPSGRYDLTSFGTAWLRITSPFPFPRVITGDLNRFSPFGGYFLRVIQPGESCLPLGVKDFSPELNSMMSVYPNPTNGQFELRLNAGNRLNGEIVVVDITGRQVFAQPLDVMGLYNTSIDLSAFAKGLYTVQVRTAEGFAAKHIVVE